MHGRAFGLRVGADEITLSMIERNRPCPCGSGKKYKRCCLLKKNRTTTVRWRFSGPPWPNHARIYPDGRIGLYRDHEALVPTDTSMLTWYGRAKKRKVVNDLAMEPHARATINLNDLLVGYTTLIAIDTNTRVIRHERVSIAGVVMTNIQRRGNRGFALLRRHAYSFRSLPAGEEELYGWKYLFDLVEADGRYRRQASIGIIVDAHLDRIARFNRREEPILPGRFLPINVTLLYATADAGGSDYAPNRMMKDCDAMARLTLDALETSMEIGGQTYALEDERGPFTVWTALA